MHLHSNWNCFDTKGWGILLSRHRAALTWIAFWIESFHQKPWHMLKSSSSLSETVAYPFLKRLAFPFRLHCSVVQCIYLRDTRLCVLSVPGVGVRNITALGNLISWQKVDYDFNYHQMEFPCNINVLIASEGRSLLPVRTSGLSPFQRFIIKIFTRMYLGAN